jgi:uncharacterized membrane protein
VKNPISHHWGPAAAIGIAAVLLAQVPRYTFAPKWFVIVQTVMLVVTLAAPFALGARRVTLFRVATGTAIGLLALINVLSLAKVVNLVVFHPKDVDALLLLGSSTAIWVINVLIFALSYWLLDGGGPELRLERAFPRDFAFPQAPQGITAAPNFFDYVFLSFTTATAFSPTDTAPLTSRARLLILLESAVSLLDIVITAARAVNILS